MKKLSLFLMLTLFGSMAPDQGVVFELETVDHKSSPPYVETIEIKVHGSKIIIPTFAKDRSDTNGAMVFHGDLGEKNKIVLIDHDEKSYMVMDKETMKAMGEKMNEAMRQAEEAMKNMSKEQQAMIKKARERAGMTPPPDAMGKKQKMEIKKTGEHGTKQGFACVKYEAFKNGQKVREIWTTDWANIDGGDEAADAFGRMAAFFEEMMNSLPNFPGADMAGGENFIDELNFDDGFPVEWRDYDEGGDLEDESTLKSARRQRLDPAAFEPPVGYKRLSMLSNEKN